MAGLFGFAGNAYLTGLADLECLNIAVFAMKLLLVEQSVCAAKIFSALMNSPSHIHTQRNLNTESLAFPS